MYVHSLTRQNKFMLHDYHQIQLYKLCATLQCPLCNGKREIFLRFYAYAGVWIQLHRFIGEIAGAEQAETDRFLEECITDPSLRDKMSIINRTFQNRKRVSKQMHFSIFCSNQISKYLPDLYYKDFNNLMQVRIK